MASQHGGPLYLDLVARTVGWSYEISGVAYKSSWRPTRRGAKRAGKRALKRMHGRLD